MTLNHELIYKLYFKLLNDLIHLHQEHNTLILN